MEEVNAAAEAHDLAEAGHAHDGEGHGHEGVHRHPAPTGFIRKYIFSIDHKVIGIQYIFLALVAVLVGMTMSLLMRLNLSWPLTSWPILETLFPTGAPG